MDKKSGKLPATGIIQLDTALEQWNLLDKKLATQISTTGIIETENHKLRIEIMLVKAFSPYSSMCRNTVNFSTNFLNANQDLGISRIMKFQMDTLSKLMWVLVGYIKGKNEIPIIIVHYEKFNITLYSQKLKSDSSENFFNGFSYN